MENFSFKTTSSDVGLNFSQPWLAPLAGWSDLPFRLICREQGAAVCCTEMVSARGLVCNGGNKATLKLLTTCAEDQPLVVQLFGSEPEYLAEAAKQVLDKGFLWLDCNMGCAVPKVTRSGAGATLSRDIDQAQRVAEALIKVAGSGKVGFKIRLGWNEKTSENWRILAPALASLGAGWITLHPRTAAQGFRDTARWSAIKELKEMVSIPVIASGDLFSAEEGMRCLAETGADTVMYARGALRDPAIFAKHRQLCQGNAVPEFTPTELFALIRRHAELARNLSPSRPALLKMRTFIPHYARGLAQARSLRLAIITCEDWTRFDQIIDQFERESCENPNQEN